MDYLIITLATVAACALVALAYMSGYDLGHNAGKARGIEQANRRVRGVMRIDELVAEENARKPKSQRAKRKQVRKAARLAVGSVGLVTLLGGLQ